jgi:hypothetical protein
METMKQEVTTREAAMMEDWDKGDRGDDDQLQQEDRDDFDEVQEEDVTENKPQGDDDYEEEKRSTRNCTMMMRNIRRQ